MGKAFQAKKTESQIIKRVGERGREGGETGRGGHSLKKKNNKATMAFYLNKTPYVLFAGRATEGQRNGGPQSREEQGSAYRQGDPTGQIWGCFVSYKGRPIPN